MKRIILILAAILMIAVNADAQTKKARKNADIKEVTFITSIDCKNCVKKLEANIPFEKGVKDCRITLDDKSVWISYDAAKTDKKKLSDAIIKLGYTCEEREITEKNE